MAGAERWDIYRTGRRIFGRGSGACDAVRGEAGDARKENPQDGNGRNVCDGGCGIITGIMK